VSEIRSFLLVSLALTVFGVQAQQAPLRDPTRPLQPAAENGQRAAASPSFALSAVLVSPTRRVAVIDGELYREGDAVHGATITHIEPGLVRLRRAGGNLELRLLRDVAGAAIRQGDGS
jgi:MSHA biogenesis protein MshK